MTFNDIEKHGVERAVAAFIKRRRPPVHLRDKVDLAFRITGQSVEIFEIRPLWNRPEKKIEEAVAKARYLKTRGEWWVYWQRADMKWHRYDPGATVKNIEDFLAIVDRDEYGCFFG